MIRLSPMSLVLVALACTAGVRGERDSLSTGIGDTGIGDDQPSGGGHDGDDDGDDTGDGGGIKLDVGSPGVDTGAPSSCEVVDEMNGIGDCRMQAPPDSFEPDIQWSWTPPEDVYSIVTPLVANLTDDNGDGRIDLCDTPDIVVVATSDIHLDQPPAYIYVLDGATGSVHAKFDTPVHAGATPAIADFEADGVPEIVTASGDGRHMLMFEPTGNVRWTSDEIVPNYHGSATAVADVDNDGDVEIVYDDNLLDHEGHLLWDAGILNVVADATVIADLDGDGDQEIVFGHIARHHDGSPYYAHPSMPAGFAAIANLDDDPEPEILLTHEPGITILEHDGSIKLYGLRPTGDPGDGLNWSRPSTVHDFDGDGVSEFALSSSYHYSVFRRDASIVWSTEILDDSGIAAGTAFDFLGDGEAEAMYADEYTMFIFDGAGTPTLQVPRMSRTLIEYPVVADVDNDGSAEIVVVSNETTANESGSPTVQVIRDKQDRWIQARRIWNQHTYHVTNVREDATIPTHEPPSWKGLNTYRTNAQIEGGTVCQPVPQG